VRCRIPAAGRIHVFLNIPLQRLTKGPPETNSCALENSVRIACRIICLAAVALTFPVLTLPAAPDQLRVVATTTWTAAFSTAAGATDVIALAPPSLRHPSEYELKPADVALLRGAGLIVYSGFEAMAKKLAVAAGQGGARMLRIDADYSAATMRASILEIAAALGTEPQARRNLAALEKQIGTWKAALRVDGLSGAPVVAHVFQVPLLKDLGFDVKGVFGPGPLEAAQIAKLSSVPARFIVDNWHNEVAAPLRETMKDARYVSFINFPGPDGTSSLLDVLADNQKRLEAAR
jgi:hypothetical protein